MSEVLLSVQGLEVAYGGIRAVKGVSLEVRQGEKVCLIGSNGAGKTTTMKAITGTQLAGLSTTDIAEFAESLWGWQRKPPAETASDPR